MPILVRAGGKVAHCFAAQVMDVREDGGWVVEEVDVPDGEVGKSVGGCEESWGVEEDDLPGCTVLGSSG
jgi:hypothetical protein